MRWPMLRRGFTILGSAPWPPMLGAVAAAAALLCVGFLARGTSFAPFPVLLGLSACGGAAGFVLDEKAGDVLDCTPMSRRRRTAWRVILIMLPAAVAVGGLSAIDIADATTNWLRLWPIAAGGVAIGLGSAAGMRWAGADAPGDLAAVLAFASVALLVAIDPLRRWVTVVPLSDTANAGRSIALWCVLMAACLLLALRAASDPVHVSTRKATRMTRQ